MESPPNASGSLTTLPTAHPEGLQGDLRGLLVGTFLGLVLYGMSVHQTCTFFACSTEHTRVLKALVLVILFLETIHSALCMHASYDFLIITRAASRVPSNSGWSLHVLNIFAAVIFCFTQSLFARRVTLLWPKYGLLIALVAGFLTAGQLGTIIASTVLLYMPFSDKNVRQISLLNVAHSILVMASSEILAGALVYRLWRIRTGYYRTDSAIRCLIIYISNTGLLVGVSSLISLVFSFVFPVRPLDGSVSIVATNLYAVSLLAELNSQQEWIAKDARTTTSQMGTRAVYVHRGRRGELRTPVISSSRRHSRHNNTPESTSSGGISIHVTTEVYHDNDKEMKGAM